MRISIISIFKVMCELQPTLNAFISLVYLHFTELHSNHAAVVLNEMSLLAGHRSHPSLSMSDYLVRGLMNSIHPIASG